MSRFYATPANQAIYVRRLLQFTKGKRVNMFDPCCGKGNTLRMIASVAKDDAVTYGIEVDYERAMEARRKLNHLLYSYYEDTRVTPVSMSFMWLCPPFGNVYQVERTEVTFLRDLTEGASGKLMPGGLLGYCIQYEVLKKAASLLSTRFENIHVFTFEGRPEDQMLIVLGYRAAKKPENATVERERLSEMDYDSIPSIASCRDTAFYVQPADEVHTFQANTLETEEVASAIAQSPLWAVVKRNLPQKRGLLKQPLTPLNRAHTAVTIAAGAVGGVLGSHVLVGATERASHTDVVPTEGGVKRITTFRSQSIVRVFDKNGIHILS